MRKNLVVNNILLHLEIGLGLVNQRISKALDLVELMFAVFFDRLLKLLHKLDLNHQILLLALILPRVMSGQVHIKAYTLPTKSYGNASQILCLGVFKRLVRLKSN